MSAAGGGQRAERMAGLTMAKGWSQKSKGSPLLVRRFLRTPQAASRGVSHLAERSNFGLCFSRLRQSREPTASPHARAPRALEASAAVRASSWPTAMTEMCAARTSAASSTSSIRTLARARTRRACAPWWSRAARA